MNAIPLRQRLGPPLGVVMAAVVLFGLWLFFTRYERSLDLPAGAAFERGFGRRSSDWLSMPTVPLQDGATLEWSFGGIDFDGAWPEAQVEVEWLMTGPQVDFTYAVEAEFLDADGKVFATLSAGGDISRFTEDWEHSFFRPGLASGTVLEHDGRYTGMPQEFDVVMRLSYAAEDAQAIPLDPTCALRLFH